MQNMKAANNCAVVDLFAGAGGLTHGFILEGFNVVAGIEADETYRYAYEHNNPGARFVHSRVEHVTSEYLCSLYPKGSIKILAGCAPCQPFSSYTRTHQKHTSWQLLYEFIRLIKGVQPEIVTMENVPRLKTYENGKVFGDFLSVLRENGYFVTWNDRIYAPDYGVPQSRYRLILIASKFGEITFLPPTHTPSNYPTVRDAIGNLEPIPAGGVSPNDPLHRSMNLSLLNLERIRFSKPEGTWRDWPEELRANCHRKLSGKSYHNVYGRMSWDKPAPTITTQCYGFGNGRFGHPEQDRAISMREAALLQTFPPNYQFFDPTIQKVSISRLAMMIGNAVPVALARMIAQSIRNHLSEHFVGS